MLADEFNNQAIEIMERIASALERLADHADAGGTDAKIEALADRIQNATGVRP